MLRNSGNPQPFLFAPKELTRWAFASPPQMCSRGRQMKVIGITLHTASIQLIWFWVLILSHVCVLVKEICLAGWTKSFGWKINNLSCTGSSSSFSNLTNCAKLFSLMHIIYVTNFLESMKFCTRKHTEATTKWSVCSHTANNELATKSSNKYFGSLALLKNSFLHRIQNRFFHPLIFKRNLSQTDFRILRLHVPR